jgi:hypothetical protein
VTLTRRGEARMVPISTAAKFPGQDFKRLAT